MITIHTDLGTFQVPDNIYTLTVSTPKSLPNFMAHHIKTIRNMMKQSKDNLRGLMPLGQVVTETDLDITTTNYFASPGSYTEL